MFISWNLYPPIVHILLYILVPLYELMKGSSNFIYSFIHFILCNAVLKLYPGYLGSFFLMLCTTLPLIRLIRIYAPRPLELLLESR
jgi:uncharacterized membrane protein YfhO